MTDSGSHLVIPNVADHELRGRLAEGAYGEVWLARNTTTDTWRAVKFIQRARFDHARSFEREYEGICRPDVVRRRRTIGPGRLHRSKGFVAAEERLTEFDLCAVVALLSLGRARALACRIRRPAGFFRSPRCGPGKAPCAQGLRMSLRSGRSIGCMSRGAAQEDSRRRSERNDKSGAAREGPGRSTERVAAEGEIRPTIARGVVSCTPDRRPTPDPLRSCGLPASCRTKIER